jgi:glucosamine--fructose-6-phosphate aminotransferase (isomerizing)
MAGSLMRAEMAEQPAVLEQLLARCREAAQPLRGAAPDGVVIVARGSSDHAAVYGRYLLELAVGRPVALAAPSLITRYGARTNTAGWLVVGVSQSGETPEVVEVVEHLRAGGGRAVAITNGARSPLAEAAEVVLELGAGEERAVPATKTLTTTLAAFAVLAEALGEVPFGADELARVPAAVVEVLEDGAPAAALAEAWQRAGGVLVAARGWLYAAALESALKIREAARLDAEGYSSADLLHGPIAAVGAGDPVLAFAWPGPTAADIDELARALLDRGADLRRASPDGDLRLPAGVPEALAPIAAVVRGQQLALELALRRGLDPDAPRGLSKVTATR